MKKLTRKSISVLLSLFMVLSVCAGLTFTASAAEVLASGEVGAEGDNIIWTLTDDNVLTLSGAGATADYSTSPSWNEPGRRGPWWYTEYRDRVETVVVEEGITYLGKYLFDSNESLKHAILPDSLESLGDGVFQYCSLQELPNLGKVTAIPRSAFESCPLTETLIIPEGIKKLGNSCFKESSTKHLVLPSTMQDAGEWYQFYDCPLETVVQPASFIMAPDFEYNRLSKLTLTGDAWEFPHGRFMYLNPNTEVVIPAGSSYKGFTGLYPAVHTPWEGTWYDWQWYREELMCFNEEAMGDYDSPEAQAEDAHSSFDWNFRNENHARLVEVDNPAERPIVPDENGKYYNVFGEATVTIDYSNMTYTPVEAKDPTCGEAGNIAYYEGSDGLCYVKNDNDEYVEIALADTVISATGAHDWRWVIDQDSTCTETGLKHEKCSRCDAVQSEGTVIAAKPHNLKATAAKAPTCAKEGNIAYWQCKDCGGYFADAAGTEAITEADTVLAKLPHELQKTEAADPGCEDGNIAYWTCRNCHSIYNNAEGSGDPITPNETVIPALGHSFTSSVEAATCNSKGRVIYTCTRCGYSYEETLDRLTHEDHDGNGECDWCGFTMTPNACRWCGQVHTGTWGKIVGFFHSIFWFIRELFR